MSKQDQRKPCQTIIVDLAINQEELLKLYRGTAKDVITQSIHGFSVRFPALSLQPFVTHAGVHGRFQLEIDSDNRLIQIQLLKKRQ